MTTHLTVKIEPELKNVVARLARSEGKPLSELVRDLLANYAKERDMEKHVDDLWDSIGRRLLHNAVSESDIEKAIQLARQKNA